MIQDDVSWLTTAVRQTCFEHDKFWQDNVATVLQLMHDQPMLDRDKDVRRTEELIAQTYGLVGRARVFCGWLEPLMMLEFLHVRAAMDDLRTKLELLRGIVWGLSSHCRAQAKPFRQHRAEDDRERFFKINDFFLELLTSLCGTLLQDDRQHHLESVDSRRPTRTAADAIDLAASRISHVVVLLELWQKVLAATFPESVETITKALRDSRLLGRDSSPTSSAWDDLTDVRLPYEYESFHVFEQSLKQAEASGAQQNTIRCCLDGRRVFVTSLYHAVFRPVSWERWEHRRTIDATSRLLAQLQHLAECSRVLAEQSPSTENRNAAFVDSQCEMSSLWRSDWLNQELSPDRYARDALLVDASPTDSWDRFSWREIPTSLFREPNRELDFEAEFPTIKVGLVCPINQHREFETTLGEQLDLWGYDPSHQPEADELIEYSLTMVVAERASQRWAKNLAQQFESKSEAIHALPRLLVLDQERRERNHDENWPWPTATMSSETFDVPWLLSRIATYPWLQASSFSKTRQPNNHQADWFTQQERIHAVVGLACQWLDWQMLSLNTKEEHEVHNQSALKTFEILKRSLVRLLARTSRKESSPQFCPSELAEFLRELALILAEVTFRDTPRPQWTDCERRLAKMDRHLAEWSCLLLALIVLQEHGLSKPNVEWTDWSCRLTLSKRSEDHELTTLSRQHGLSPSTLPLAVNDVLSQCGNHFMKLEQHAVGCQIEIIDRVDAEVATR